MGFGHGSAMNLKKPGFRKKLIQDMKAVTAGQTAGNSALLNRISSLPGGVSSVTSGGRLIIQVGSTFVGDDDVVGKQEEMEITIQ